MLFDELWHELLNIPAWQVIQTVLTLVVLIVWKLVAHVLAELKSLNKEFKNYVREEQCRIHRKIIDQHIADSEARIEKMLSHCKKRSEDGIG